MPIQAYFDDSGARNQGSSFVLGGFLARSEAWAAFSDEWRACLGAEPSIKYFKMREAGAKTPSGEFAGWRTEAVDRKVRDLAEIIPKYTTTALAYGVDLVGFEIFRNRLVGAYRDPYLWAFTNACLLLASELYLAGLREPFELIFDEHVRYSRQMRAHYPHVLEVMEPEFAAIMPSQPLFRPDYKEDGSGLMPLQAADMMAWLLRRGTSEQEPHRFGFLKHVWRKVKPFSGCRYFSREDMLKVLEDQMERLVDPVGHQEREVRDRTLNRFVLGLPVGVLDLFPFLGNE